MLFIFAGRNLRLYTNLLPDKFRRRKKMRRRGIIRWRRKNLRVKFRRKGPKLLRLSL